MATAKKAADKTAKSSTGAKAGGRANSAFMKPMTPSLQLATIVGKDPLPRTEVTKKIWEYIKANNLQDEKNRRNINADEKLKPIFGKPQVTMFEMTKLISGHLS